MDYTLTVGMTHEQWLAERKRGIGSSDIGSVLGLNKFKTPRRVFDEKLGLVEPEPENANMRWGTLLEPFLHTLYMERHPGIKLVKDNKVRMHPELPFALCNIDRVIQGGPDGPEILEFKTTTSFAVKNWDAAVPTSYYAQVQWQLGITGWKRAHIFVAVLDTKEEIELDAIERNDEFIDAMFEKAADFWFHVQNADPQGIPMEVSDFDRYKPVEGTKTEATPEVMEQVSELKKVKAAITELEKTEEMLKDSLKLAIGESELLVEPGTDRVLAKYRSVSKKGYTVEPKTIRQFELAREKKEKV